MLSDFWSYVSVLFLHTKEVNLACRDGGTCFDYPLTGKPKQVRLKNQRAPKKLLLSLSEFR